MPTQEQIQQAKDLLKEAGYFVDNLWHIDDVKDEHECTDEEAMKVLEYALTGDGTRQTILDAIEDGIDYVMEQPF